MIINPQEITGPWQKGFVLDWHTISSQFVGNNELGRPMYETKRSVIGELLYQFKYDHKEEAFVEIIKIIVNEFGGHLKGEYDLIIPTPASEPTRKITTMLAEKLGDKLGIKYSGEALFKIKSTDELKNVDDPVRRREILNGVFDTNCNQLSQKRVLLVDDIYRSGATLEEATKSMLRCDPKYIHVLAVTRTRVNK